MKNDGISIMTKEPVLSAALGVPRILGLRVFQGDVTDAVEAVGALTQAGEPTLVVTANVDHAIDLSDGTELVAAYDAAHLRFIDGTPLLWAFRAIGARRVSRVTGADLIFVLTAAARERGWSIAITGGSDHVLQAAARRLREQFAGASVTAVLMPQLDAADDVRGRGAVDALRAIEPDIVFVCLGAPKQESWFLAWRELLPNAVYVGAGAAVDFAAGERRRAPAFIQSVGMEWTWRLSQEFTRLAPRYLIKGPRFLGILASSIAHARGAGS